MGKLSIDTNKYKALLKRFSLYCLFIALDFGLAYWMLWATREPRKNILALAISIPISLLMPFPLGFWAIIFPLVLIVGLYSPVAHLYGPPSYDRLIALIGTDKTEALEFLGLIPFRFYLIFIAILITVWLIHKFTKIYNLSVHNNKTFLIFCIIFLVYLAKPIHFFGQIISSIKEYKEISNFSLPSSWLPSITSINNKDYILIIGESARKDYFQIYGYPLENNPFLSKANAVIVDGLFSGGTHTAISLSNMLTAGNDWTPRFDRTFVGLAKSAGIPITWVTNNQIQKIGIYETPITALSTQADTVIDVNPELNDLELLYALFPEIDKKSSSSRLFIVHTHGSHPDVCERIKGMANKYVPISDLYSYLACYVSSIKLTDKLIQSIYEKLVSHQQATGRPFSIIYFSDHGLRTIKEKGRLLLVHGDNIQKGFEVPLIKIDSDATGQKHLKSVKSGLKFTEGLANWMQIKNLELGPYDLFDGKDDETGYGLEKMIPNTEVDEPIDITGNVKMPSAVKGAK